MYPDSLPYSLTLLLTALTSALPRLLEAKHSKVLYIAHSSNPVVVVHVYAGEDSEGNSTRPE